MSDITIGVALISGDNLEQLQRLLPQLAKFDQVIIGWNGSDPDVKKYLDKLSTPRKSPYEYFQFDWRDSAYKTKTVYPFGKDGADPLDQHPIPDEYHGINEWGFSYARNLTFKRLKTTHAIWIDTDDMIGFMKDGKDHIVSADMAYNAFKKIATEAPEDIDVWFSNYVYSRDADNNPNVMHARERMLKNPSDWKWVYPIHEVLVPNHEPKWAMIKDVQFIHYPARKEGSSAERNLRMLSEWKEQLENAKVGIEEVSRYDHDLSRAIWYMGETYWSLEEWKKAATVLVQFVRDYPRALDVEKWQAWCYIAKCQMELENFEAAQTAALAAIGVEPGLPDGYILLAQCKLVTEQDPQDILILIDTASRMDDVPPQIIKNPLDYTFTQYCIVSKCKYMLEQYDSALEWALKAQEVCPNDLRAEDLRSQAAAKIRERDAANAVKALYQFYIDFEENEKAEKLYEILPYVAQRNGEVRELATAAKSRVRHLHDRDEYVSFYKNNSRWTPIAEEDIDEGVTIGAERASYLLGRLKESVPPGSKILDVGCSDGFHSLLYARNGYKVVGIDLDPRCVKLANERAERLGLDAKFIHGFFEEMNPEITKEPFDNEPFFHHFDAVVCSEVIEHVPDPLFLLGSLVDCAKDNAPVLITTPDEAYDKGDIPEGFGMDSGEMAGHARVYTQETFENTLKADAEVHVIESHFLSAAIPMREHQGWQVGEVRRMVRPNGPIIRIYCGETLDFSPFDVNTKGMGGSELAVVQMAKHWAKAGCQVVVYNGGDNGIYDGVFYRNAEHYDPNHPSNLFISWRLPTMFDKQRPNADVTVFWAHDLYYPLPKMEDGIWPWPQEWIDRIDKFIVLSKFHADYFSNVHPNIPHDKIIISRNGIDPDRFINRNIERVPHKYFYTSSWDRGLEELLQVWPQIKEAIPDAELHIGYGIETAEKYYKSVRDTEKLNRLYSVTRKARDLDGVVYHDRLGQQELADLMLSCEAWLYPPQPDHPNGMGGFLETYCITALEAQAAGCRIISRVNGALAEVIKVPLIWDENLTTEDLIKVLQRTPEPDAQRIRREWALKQTWQSLAIQWLQLLAPKEGV